MLFTFSSTYNMIDNQEFSSNCYWFVYAGLHNSDEDFYKCADDIEYWKTIKKWKLDDEIHETTGQIIDVLWDITIIEIFDEDWKSQHVAFLDYNWKFYDQDGPDWPIRKHENLDNLFAEYREKLGNISFKLHSIKASQIENVQKFLENL